MENRAAAPPPSWISKMDSEAVCTYINTPRVGVWLLTSRAACHVSHVAGGGIRGRDPGGHCWPRGTLRTPTKRLAVPAAVRSALHRIAAARPLPCGAKAAAMAAWAPPPPLSLSLPPPRGRRDCLRGYLPRRGGSPVPPARRSRPPPAAWQRRCRGGGGGGVDSRSSSSRRSSSSSSNRQWRLRSPP